MSATTVAPERVEAPQKGFAGQSIPRKEDKRLVQGQGVYVDDVRRHEMGYVHFVRSPYAHAAITSIDVSKALELDGVYGAIIGEEVAALTDPFFQLSVPPGSEIKDYALAVGKVRHVGDPVAAVAARTRELARDAAELVEVEYEPLPVVVDPERALDEDAAVLHEEAGSNLVWSGEFDWGGFGNKICTHPQLVALCLLARKLNRPVQWTEWRTDQHTGNSHGNERVFLDVEVPVKADGTMLGFRCKAIDDCGAYSRYEPLGCIIWAQVTPGLYRWRSVRIDFSQVATNKSPCGPNRGYSRMQHLWFTERIIDIVAHELELDPVEIRKRNYIKAEEMPYETPNGCVYDSGDYARCLDMALELIGYESLEERRRNAESRGKLLGVGIGSTLDSGTNNFGQSQLPNPDLQFSGNNEVATAKLDIFGEVVITLGTTPQGQSHETVASQVVSDILGLTPEQVHVRAGHDSYWNTHAGFSGTYASQFAVTGLGAVSGATEMLADQI